MALTVLKNIIRPTRCSQLNPVFSRLYSLWEPDYLATLKPKFPLHPNLSITIKSYDFEIVEKFQGFIHKIVENMDCDIESSLSMPAKETKIVLYKPKSSIVENEHRLNLYERTVQVSNVSSTTLPILVRVLEASLPMGSILSVENHDPEKENRRFVPDKELLDMKEELEEVNKQ